MDIQTITIAVIRNRGEYLIAKRAATKKFAPNQWEFISGFIDSTDTSEETILREIKEELGVNGNIMEKANQFYFTDNEGEWSVTPFLVELDTQDIQMNPIDHSEIKWVVANELSGFLDLKPFLDNKGIQEFIKS